ncbi:MAG: HAD hydrolase-like protein [Pseudomonadota bacterium]|nr:HAD hydrolase-like protein [Pseudomonadota bacterium]
MAKKVITLPKAVLFDWDNTLVDTWPIIHDSMNVTLKQMGRSVWTLEETQERVRRSLREAFPEMFGEEWKRARNCFYERFREIHLKGLKELPGAESVLKIFHKKNVYLGVVSNKMGNHLRKEVNHLGWNKYFGGLVGATDAIADKPSVEPVIMALQGSGIEPSPEVWFIGDTKIDMECAYRSGCTGVFINKRIPNSGDFMEFMPKIHFIGCNELATKISLLT